VVLSKDFVETVKKRAQQDPRYRRALLREAIECLLAGEIDTGKAILRDYINATIGFVELGKRTKLSPKSLMRMFSPEGNPQAKKLFAVIAELQKQARLKIRVETRHSAKAA